MYAWIFRNVHVKLESRLSGFFSKTYVYNSITLRLYMYGSVIDDGKKYIFWVITKYKASYPSQCLF